MLAVAHHRDLVQSQGSVAIRARRDYRGDLSDVGFVAAGGLRSAEVALSSLRPFVVGCIHRISPLDIAASIDELVSSIDAFQRV